MFGLLLESVTRNLSDIGRARFEARSLQFAELRAREIELELASGAVVEDGVSEGAFDPPDEDLQWHIAVSPHTLQLPDDYPGEKAPSPLFALPGAQPASGTAGADVPPPLRLVEIRVFAVDDDPNDAEPFVLLVTAPPDAALLEQIQPSSQGPDPADAAAETLPR